MKSRKKSLNVPRQLDSEIFSNSWTQSFLFFLIFLLFVEGGTGTDNV